MPQYPQGIFQSLQWLMKKVKILALQKQPTYTNIDLSESSYNILGRGVYKIIQANGIAPNFFIYFPDPNLLNGQTIILINSDPDNYQQIHQDSNAPYIQGSNQQLNQIPSYSLNEFISIDGRWVSKSQQEIF